MNNPVFNAKLPKEIFGEDFNATLLAQAIRVYQNRLHPRRGKTKTRSEVIGTTAKWYRQKGTGRARHGALTAPIFVGGGIAHGPRGVRRILSLPRAQIRKALASALSQRFKDGKVFLVDIEGISPKTREAAALLGNLGIGGQKILVLHAKENNFTKAIANLSGVQSLEAREVNAYHALKFPYIVITRSGLARLLARFGLRVDADAKSSRVSGKKKEGK